MFAVIYRWKLIPGRETQFEQGWRAATRTIAEQSGGWGSRLHRGDDGIAFAYAQWPDRATWQRAMQPRPQPADDEARASYRASYDPSSFEIVFAGDVTADLLQHHPA